MPLDNIAFDHCCPTPPAEVRHHDSSPERRAQPTGPKTAINGQKPTQNNQNQVAITAPTSPKDLKKREINTPSWIQGQAGTIHNKITSLLNAPSFEPMRAQKHARNPKEIDETQSTTQEEATNTKSRYRHIDSEVRLRGLLKQEAHNKQTKDQAIKKTKTRLSEKIAAQTDRRKERALNEKEEISTLSGTHFDAEFLARIEEDEAVIAQYEIVQDTKRKANGIKLEKQYEDEIVNSSLAAIFDAHLNMDLESETGATGRNISHITNTLVRRMKIATFESQNES